MAQESYADFSIIHKYFQQEKLHEEEMQRFKDQLKEMTESLAATTKDSDSLKTRVRELSEENDKLQQSVSDRENDINRLNSTINNLNQKIAAMTKSGR